MQNWVDTVTGEVSTTFTPCKSIHCHRLKCRKSIYWELVEAFDSVKQDFKYSTLITVNHLPVDHDSIPKIRLIIHEVLAKKLRLDVKSVSVVEDHKYPNAVHVHCLVLGNKRFRRHIRKLIVETLSKVLPVDSQVHFSNRRTENSSLKYLLKNFLNNPVKHLELNGDRVVSLSRGFWLNSRTASKKNRRRRLNASISRRRWKRDKVVQAKSEVDHYYLDSLHVWELCDSVERERCEIMGDVPLVMRI